MWADAHATRLTKVFAVPLGMRSSKFGTCERELVSKLGSELALSFLKTVGMKSQEWTHQRLEVGYRHDVLYKGVERLLLDMVKACQS